MDMKQLQEGASIDPEELDGVEVEKDSDGGADDIISEPYNPSDTKIDSVSLALYLLIERMRHDEIDLQPEFQRRGDLWNARQKSQLIESLLLRIPLPGFYFDGTDNSRWQVVDGLQRLTTIHSFVVQRDFRKRLKLSNLEYLKDLDGKTYEELPRAMQRRIDETQVNLHIIRPGTPGEVKYNIFKRINTGGLTLTGQEIRHALNPGPVLGFLKALCKDQSFLLATGEKVSPKRMLDRELVLRFCAFMLSAPESYRDGGMDRLLNKTMERLNEVSEEERNALGQSFVRAMGAAHRLLGDEAFRRQRKPEGPKMPINKALFEAWSVSLAALSDEELETLYQARDRLLKSSFELYQRADFENALTRATGDAKRLKLRFRLVRELVAEVIREEALHA